MTGADGESVGVVSIQEAVAAAEEAGMDLVEISPNAEPPVCRVMDYGKFLFEKSKSAKEQKKKQKQVQIKEVKFRPGTDIGDYQVKLRNLTRFLEEGNKVKVTIRFRGREMAHQDIGVDVLHRLKEEYNLELELQRSSFSVARWPRTKEDVAYEGDIKGNMTTLVDTHGEKVVLLDKEWDLQWAERENPDVIFAKSIEPQR